ncbi:Sporulation kinase E [Sporomusa ovata DSM 2662]|uniref:histidine kinase n=1 Tax=Sporomusa ovata TaxID=2378 RepID=A0A0U1KZ93_9FIRM|nr:ATP-binding protein [Sporomusa ovata]EQB27802.1 sporulation kinase E [Sporomusa ovata DSM 2662]CQR72732.1 sporulation kinase [Sporomusa ovata]
MQGKTKDPLKLTGDLCDEDKMLSTMQNIGDLLGMVFLFLSKMILNYHFRNYSAALRFGEKVKANLAGASATIDIAIYYFYDSLTRLALYSIRSDAEKKVILKKVNKNQRMMSIWSEFSPFNFLHKFYLVEAEICRVTGKFFEARKHYDKAIGLAKENEYLNEEALAYELAGNFYLSDGRKNSAKAYFREARYRYQLWGAKAKVNELEDKYPKFFMKSRNLQDISKNIDLLTIIKASQAISSEINLETLLNRLMTVMLENMGAQRGFLILKQEDELLIEAYVDKEWEEEKLLIAMPLDKCESIPKTVIRFTARTGENVVFPGNLQKLSIDNDPYISANKPKSFFSTAIILKNELKGVLYLENNLAENVFSPDRVKVIELLSAQAAISLENALLYNTLEQKEAALAAFLDQLKMDLNSFAQAMYDGRALEFNSEIAELTPILKYISKQTEKMTHLDRLNIICEMAAGIAHEVRNPMTTVRGLLQFLENKQELTGHRDKFELMINEIDRANSIITEFLSLAKNKVMDFTESNLNDIIRDIYPLLQADALRNNSEIVITLENIPNLILDRNSIRQIIFNIVRNGLDAMPGGGLIDIKTWASGSKVLLVVKDCGIGILPENKGNLWKPFFTTKDNGTGLGLAVCYRIAQRHGATITVESEPQKGTVFTVEFNQNFSPL